MKREYFTFSAEFVFWLCWWRNDTLFKEDYVESTAFKKNTSDFCRIPHFFISNLFLFSRSDFCYFLISKYNLFFSFFSFLIWVPNTVRFLHLFFKCCLFFLLFFFFKPWESVTKILKRETLKSMESVILEWYPFENKSCLIISSKFLQIRSDIIPKNLILILINPLTSSILGRPTKLGSQISYLCNKPDAYDIYPLACREVLEMRISAMYNVNIVTRNCIVFFIFINIQYVA